MRGRGPLATRNKNTLQAPEARKVFFYSAANRSRNDYLRLEGMAGFTTLVTKLLIELV